MHINFRLNGQNSEFEVSPGQSLLSILRSNGVLGIKHGCETGECGACTVLVDGVPMNSCVMLAVQAAGRSITTIEGIGGTQMRGWRGSEPLHALQKAFIETGAIQCGYCTPAMILAASALLHNEPNPTEAQVRAALSGVLCRCTGYLKPVQAVLRAAAVLRGDQPLAWDAVSWDLGDVGGPMQPPDVLPGEPSLGVSTKPKVVVAPQTRTWNVVGKPEKKVD